VLLDIDESVWGVKGSKLDAVYGVEKVELVSKRSGVLVGWSMG
jgi:hypothetical protein